MTLPRLYTLKEVREALQVGPEYVRLALKRYPQIRPVGRGRGTRLTYEDYMLLLELMRQAPEPMAPLHSSAGVRGTADNAIQLRKSGATNTRANLRELRKRLLAEIRGNKE